MVLRVVAWRGVSLSTEYNTKREENNIKGVRLGCRIRTRQQQTCFDREVQRPLSIQLREGFDEGGYGRREEQYEA